MGIFQLLRNARGTDRFIKAQNAKPHPDTCVIVGNGPSLQPAVVAAINRAEADVYISNFAYENPLLFERANVLGMVNPLVIEQAVDGLEQCYTVARAAGQSVPTLLLPESLSGQMPAVAAPHGVATAATPGFQLHPIRGASTQSTVTYFLLQIAFWVGYKRVTLIGVDNTYNQPPVAEGVVITQVAADVNHFSADYFRGRRWEAADTQRMAAVISLAASAYLSHGRALTNSTVGGALDVLPRESLGEVLKKSEFGAVPAALNRGESLCLYVRSLLSVLRSRRMIGMTLLTGVVLAMASVMLPLSGISAAWIRTIVLGAALCGFLVMLTVGARLWERNVEVANLREFERRSQVMASSNSDPNVPG